VEKKTWCQYFSQTGLFFKGRSEVLLHFFPMKIKKFLV
jgi:hypothetical protein